MINGTDLLGLHARKSATVLTARAEWRYTSWTWRKISWCNSRRRSRVNYYWSCLARSWSLRSGEDLEVGNNMDFRGELWCTLEDRKVRDTCHHLGWGQILTTTYASYFFDCQRACWRDVRRAELVGDLLMPLMFAEGRGSEYKFRSSGFNCRLYNWLLVVASVGWISLGSNHVSRWIQKT